jgi:hypothetical protein
MSILVIILPIGAIAYLVFRLCHYWQLNRPEPGSDIAISSEELNREKPASTIADISYDHLDLLLERIEHAVNWGFKENQRNLLILRTNSLFPRQMISAKFPVRYDTESTDALMQFIRINYEVIRCRFEASKKLVIRIDSFLEDIPQISI